MMLGLSLPAFTLLHVAISLVGIAAGGIWLLAVIGGRFLTGWNSVFLWGTFLTSVTGFMFPFKGFTPALAVGAVSTIDLAIAALALWAFGRAGGWRIVYLVTATIALYLNTFVLVVQSFLKIGPLNALAPTGTEPAFVAAQAAVLIGAAALGFVAVRRTRRLVF